MSHKLLLYLINVMLNPIRSGIFQTANEREGALNPPLPYDLQNNCLNLHHINIIHVHFTKFFRHVPIRIFQKFTILTILQRFKNKK